MKREDMKPLVPYVVTRASSDGSFLCGDHITLLEDGAIFCDEAKGWITAEDLAAVPRSTDFHVEPDIDKVNRLRQRLRDMEQAAGIAPGSLDVCYSDGEPTKGDGREPDQTD
jgi:hypothetical protein